MLGMLFSRTVRNIISLKRVTNLRQSTWQISGKSILLSPCKKFNAIHQPFACQHPWYLPVAFSRAIRNPIRNCPYADGCTITTFTRVAPFTSLTRTPNLSSIIWEVTITVSPRRLSASRRRKPDHHHLPGRYISRRSITTRCLCIFCYRIWYV